MKPLPQRRTGRLPGGRRPAQHAAKRSGSLLHAHSSGAPSRQAVNARHCGLTTDQAGSVLHDGAYEMPSSSIVPAGCPRGDDLCRNSMFRKALPWSPDTWMVSASGETDDATVPYSGSTVVSARLFPLRTVVPGLRSPTTLPRSSGGSPAGGATECRRPLQPDNR